MRRLASQAALLALIAFACAISLFATQAGIGASPDSVAYVGAARNLLSGRGLSLPYGDRVDSPLTQYPPLYPGALAAVAIPGGNVLGHARWLSALLFGANIAVVALFAAEELSRTRWMPLVAGVAFMVSPSIASLHMMAWSEPLFLFLGGLGLWLLYRSCSNSSWWYVILAGLLFGCATLTRYAGLAYTVTGCVALISESGWKWRQRLVRSGTLVAIAVAPITLWVARNRWLYGSATGRAISFHPVGRADLWMGLNTAADWLLIPQGWPRRPEMVFGLTIAAALVIGVPLYRRWRGRRVAGGSLPRSWNMRRLLLLFVACYFAFLLLSISLVDANTQLDSRILSPVLMALIPVVVSGVHEALLGLYRQSLLHKALTVLPAFFLLFMASHTANVIRVASMDGIGFNHRRWRDSALIAKAATLPEDSLIYSNAPEPIYLLAGRRSVRLPKEYESMGGRPNPEFQADLQKVRDSMLESDGRLVYFDRISASSQPALDELSRLVPLAVEFEDVDGSIFGLAGGR